MHRTVNDQLSIPGLKHILQAALASVSGERLVRDALKRHPITKPCYLVSLGKSAESMAAGALTLIGDKISDRLVIPYTASWEHSYSQITATESGQRLIDFIESTPPHAHLLFLLSSGVEQVVEHFKPNVTWSRWQEIRDCLTINEFTPAEIQMVAMRLSSIKNAGLWHTLRERVITEFILADKIADETVPLGGSLLHPMPVESWRSLSTKLPLWIIEYCGEECLPPICPQLHHQVVGTQRDVLKAIYHVCQMQGLKPTMMAKELPNETHAAATAIAERLSTATPGVYVWGTGGDCEVLTELVEKQLSAKHEVTLIANQADWGPEARDVVVGVVR